MKSAMIILSAVLLAGNAVAQPTEPNALGVFFDLEATIIGTCDPGFSTCYLILVNPTMDAVSAFDLNLEVVSTIQFFEGFHFPTIYLGTLVSLPNDDIYGNFYDPMPVMGQALILVSSLYSYTGTGSAQMTIGPAQDHPEVPGQMSIIDGAGNVVAAVDPAGGEVCARIDEGACDIVAAEATPFGSLKALYR